MRDERAILDLIETIYLCGAGNAGWDQFVNQFGKRYPALKVGLTCYDSLYSELQAVWTANFDPHYIDQFSSYYFKINPWQKLIQNSPPAPAVGWGHEAVPISELERTEFYADWVKPQENIVTGFTTMLLKEHDRFVNLAINVGSKHLAEAQVAARDIALIGPHLRRAFELNRQLLGARLQEETYRSVLDTLLAAVFIVDSTGVIQFANAKGERLLREERVVKSGVGGRLGFTTPQDHRAVAERIRRTAVSLDGYDREIIPLQTAGPRGRYTAFVTAWSGQREVPVRRGSTAILPAKPVAVFVIDSTEAPQAQTDNVARALNVTPAEARLAMALLRDNTLKQYAEQNGISIHTARGQLKSLLEKTGTHRQAALVRRLAGLFSGFCFD